MSAFDRLSSALQYQIVNTLSYRELRPVQEAAIGPVLDGKNAVVLAPTAGGKTEAAFFPLLAAMDTEDWRPVSVLYLSPIRALLNNQEERVAKLSGIRLYREGFVEDVRPSRRAAHILAHQLMGLSIQSSGIGRGDWWAWVEGCTAFEGIRVEEREAIVQHMLDATILSEQDGKLWLGIEGEKRYGRANFRELYAVFDVPRLVTVRSNTEEIGTVDALFLMTLDSDGEPGSFTLAGRAWQILTIDWGRGICAVRPAPAGRPPRWAGGPRHLRFELCQAMRRIQVEDEMDPCWSPRARNVLSTMRAEHMFLREEAAPLLESQDGIT